MGLLDEIQAEQEGRKPGPKCSVCKLLASLDGDDLADLEAALENPGLQAAAIYRALRSRGQLVNLGAVQKHCRGEAH